MGVSHSCLDDWVRQAKIDQGKLPASAGLTTEELRELAVLRRENRRLKEELDIVKRAAALFARDNILAKMKYPPGGNLEAGKDLQYQRYASF